MKSLSFILQALLLCWTSTPSRLALLYHHHRYHVCALAMACPQVTLHFPERLRLRPVTMQTGLFIDNEFVEAKDQSTFETLNPATGRALARVSSAQACDVHRAVSAARRAFDCDGTWSGTKANLGGAYRGECISKLARAIQDQEELIAAIETLDNGKTYATARKIDVPGAIAWLQYYAGWADKNSGQTLDVDPTKLAYTIHEPLGVVGQIIPWNFPLLMFAWKIGPALATGNTIVLKPAEQTPLSVLYVCGLIKDIFPKGVINIVPGLGPIAGQALVEHPAVDKIAFTGSTAIGKRIMQTAAQANLKPVTLELGGKSPNIIFEDADLNQAVKWAGYGIYFNHGQCCCAGSRIYVQESIYEKFMEAFVEHVKSLTVGDPFDEGTFQGPQITQLQYDRIMGYINSGRQDGATCLLGGGRVGEEGYFIEPTVFTGVRPDMKIMREEIFGPVAAVCKFSTEEEVVQMANDSIYGLAAGVHSRDLELVMRMTRKLKAGTIWVNCYNCLYSQLPFGGFKQSGIGRENGKYALDHYTAVKTVQINISQRL